MKETNQTDKIFERKKEMVLTLLADNTNTIKGYVNAAFEAHTYFKIHNGKTMKMGQGAVISISKRKKLNTRSSTESELLTTDDAIMMILWTIFLTLKDLELIRTSRYKTKKAQ